MADKIKSVDFLPNIFKTPTNEKYLSSTLDQLVQEPDISKVQGYVGKVTGPATNKTDTYISEINNERQNYQLEPSIIFKDVDGKATDAITYPGILDGLQIQGANVTNPDRLFSSDVYSWDPLFDYDKFINYSQYYWLPSGPDAIEVGIDENVLIDGFTIVRTENDYDFENFGANNPTITLVKGRTYTFNVSQYGIPFYIQTEQGIDGTVSWDNSLNSRDVEGVTNNGVDVGVLEITIPTTSALSELYYQDALNEDIFGIIKVISEDESNVLFVEDIIDRVSYVSPNGVEFSNGMKIAFRGSVFPSIYEDNEFYVEGVGTGIKLLNTNNFIIPENYATTVPAEFDNAGFDTSSFGSGSNSPTRLDYITINRGSQDNNAWSRSNRWFHRDVIQITGLSNENKIVLDNNFRAKRPIIEFQSNIGLFNHGTISKGSVSLFSLAPSDALSNIHGSTSAMVDGYALSNNQTIIFSNDNDLDVATRIYTVRIEDVNGIATILLDETDTIEDNNQIVVQTGEHSGGSTYAFIDGEWKSTQAKTRINQPPLFDVFDADEISYGDLSKYGTSSFTGSKLFSYKVGSTPIVDTELGFPLSYFNIDNLGDIIFENNQFSDLFTYVGESEEISENIGNGFIRRYNGTNYDLEIGWTKSVEPTRIPQVFTSIYDGVSIDVDITPDETYSSASIILYINNVFIPSTNYTIEILDNGTSIIPDGAYFEGDAIEVSIISNDISKTGYFDVPTNLSKNIFNEDTSEYTLGIIRNHYTKLAQTLPNLEGPITGNNNLRDMGRLGKYGNVLIKHSAPMSFVSQFLRKTEHNFYEALNYNSSAYEQFKSNMLNWTTKNTINTEDSGELLETILVDINLGKTSNSTFFNSDMIGFGLEFNEHEHLVTAISDSIFETNYVYDFTKANNKSLLVYHNNLLLIKDYDYVVSSDAPSIEITIDLAIDDTIRIKEYSDTLGSFIPSTPTKMGLYKKFKPRRFIDDTYLVPTEVIQGHDGSITPIFGDARDAILMEFETRIYNNIKVSSSIPLSEYEVIPGNDRVTDYTVEEINKIIIPSVLNWTSNNNLDYTEQHYRADKERTWNYGKALSNLDDTPLKGHWRGIFKFFYDTDRPHTHPWEMLGQSEKPNWWDAYYGVAPYTSNNLVLWDDLRDGIFREPNNPRVLPRFKRKDLLQILPVDSEGNLLTPMDKIVGHYNSNDIRAKWVLGDDSPVESAFKKSSAWPFAIQRLLSLTRPAKYFSLMVDRDHYNYNETFGQYLVDNRTNLNSKTFTVPETHSYISWIAEYNTHFGYNSNDTIQFNLKNADVNLCYRMASFSDKKMLKIFTDKSSPDSTNKSLLMPDESYQLLLYKNQPYETISYSAITFQRVGSTIVVTGNSAKDPFFKIHKKIDSTNVRKIPINDNADINDEHLLMPLYFSDDITLIPYGHIFVNNGQAMDFLFEYGNYLERSGLTFETRNKFNEISNWILMAKEFLTWSAQGWVDGSVINLNPSAAGLTFERDLSIVNSLLDSALADQPQDQNKRLLDIKDYTVDRVDNKFNLTMLNDAILGYVKFDLTNFEHLLIIDNVSIFNDIIYTPNTGIRQQRIKMSGYTTGKWNGQMDTPGFIINDDNIVNWVVNKRYKRGEIVRFKNKYWMADTTINPSDEFVFDKWIKVDYSTINKGMLPNLATRSDSMLDLYNHNYSNLEEDANLLSMGLIGFSPRQYMLNLDLDDVSQVNLYKDMIANKGTTNSLNLFKNIKTNDDYSDYSIYENWMIKRSTYGATSSRSYVEFLVDANEHKNGITTIEITDDYRKVSESSQLVTLDNIYKQSVKHNSTNIFPMVKDLEVDEKLPYAGFVDSKDVDLSLWTLNDIQEDDLEQILDGTLIWVAKDTKYDWNVYRCNAILPELVAISDCLTDDILLKFNAPHNLNQGDIIVVKYFDSNVDGIHIVSDIQNASEFKVQGNITVTEATSKRGIVFVLKSALVDSISAIADSTTYNNKFYLEDKVWIENPGTKSKIIEKVLPYNEINYLEVTDNPERLFGKAISQGNNNSGLLVSDPHNNTVYGYSKSPTTGTYFKSAELTLPGIDVKNYGGSLSFAENFAVIGADGTMDNTGIAVVMKRDLITNTFEEYQILSLPDTWKFGENVEISDDEEWIFVTENNKIHVFNKEDDTNPHEIEIDCNEELSHDISVLDIENSNAIVKLNGTLLIQNVDFNISNNVLTLTNVPPLYAILRVSRITRYVHKNILSFFGSPNDSQMFGHSMSLSHDASQMLVSSPAADSDAIFIGDVAIPPEDSAGKVYVIQRVIERFVVVTPSNEVTKLRNSPINNVTVNGIERDYTSTNNSITIENYTVKVGDVVLVDLNEFELVQVIQAETPNQNAMFGSKVIQCKTKCSAYIGSSKDSTLKQDAGSVTRLVDTSIITGAMLSPVVNPTLVINNTIRINQVDVICSSDNIEQLAIDIIDAKIPNIFASVTNGQLLIELVNKEVKVNRLEVRPGVGNLYRDLGFEIFTVGEIITSPLDSLFEYAEFGTDIGINDDGSQVVISARNGNAYNLTTYDNELEEEPTTFDGNTMRNIEVQPFSGVAYSYDVVREDNGYYDGRLIFGQQIAKQKLQPKSAFGQVIDYNGTTLVVGAPSNEQALTFEEATPFVSVFENKNAESSWQVYKESRDSVDVQRINQVLLYDAETSETLDYLDYVDPLNGKILGTVSENLDYITFSDPAVYSASSRKVTWDNTQVDQIWWDTSTCRFLDYHYDDLNFSTKVWGNQFPGSSIDMYQWTKSDNPPSAYTGQGVVRNVDEYVSISYVTSTNLLVNNYYFWVKGNSSIVGEKTLSLDTMSRYISSPKQAGIPYVTFNRSNALTLVNTDLLVSENNAVIHVEYDKIKNDNEVFVEYEIIKEDKEDSFLPDLLYKKFLDSLCGFDEIGNVVPDRALSPLDKVGVSFRPRQTMFKNRFKALKGYIDTVNNILRGIRISELSNFPLLHTYDETPDSSKWDISTLNYAELMFLDINEMSIGTKVLVEYDENINDAWTIYEVKNDNGIKIFNLIRNRYFNTSDYWEYTDWYEDGYNSNTTVDILLDSLSGLNTTIATSDKVVKVKFNTSNKWELYKQIDDVWTRIGLQDGTIQLSTGLYDYASEFIGYGSDVYNIKQYDQEPSTELRYILRSVNEEMFVDTLAIHKNKLLVLMFKYIMSEHKTPVEWLHKSSLLNVTHKVRSLVQSSVYKKDQQDFVSNYIKEAKPYHCKIREFLLLYDTIEQINTSITDFDCPSTYNDLHDKFISPILDDGAILVSDTSNTVPSDRQWTETPWDQWFKSYKLTVNNIIITNGGTGYTTAPQVIVHGETDEPSLLLSRINGAGEVIAIDITSEGAGYKSNPTIEIIGDGTGAKATVNASNKLVRSYDITMKYDRCAYDSDIMTHDEDTLYVVGDRVRYENDVYEATIEHQGSFKRYNFDLVGQSTLSGIDRTMGLYDPSEQNSGINLSLLVDGVTFPGVEVDGTTFEKESIIDVAYSSVFEDSYLGTRTTDIDVNGGHFVDNYHGHSPEELVNGTAFDTVDIKVYSRPNERTKELGYAFSLDSKVYSISGDTIDLSNILEISSTIHVYNVTTGCSLYESLDYSINWELKEVHLLNNFSINDDIKVSSCGIGGGTQLFRETITGIEIVDDVYILPVNINEIKDVVIFSNGEQLLNYTFTENTTTSSNLTFSDGFSDTENITIIVLGFSDNNVNYIDTEAFKVNSLDGDEFNNCFFGTARFNTFDIKHPLIPVTIDVENNTQTETPFVFDGVLQGIGNSNTYCDFIPNDYTGEPDYNCPNPQTTDIYLENPTGGNSFDLDEEISSSDIITKMNAIVEINGKRMRPPSGKRYISNGMRGYTLPFEYVSNKDTNVYQQNISKYDVVVILNGEVLEIDIDYTLSEPVENSLFNTGGTYFDEATFACSDQQQVKRFIKLENTPNVGSTIDIYVTKNADYRFIDNKVIFKQDIEILTGDSIAVTKFGSTDELHLLTEVFKGTQLIKEVHGVPFGNSYDQSVAHLIRSEYVSVFDEGPQLDKRYSAKWDECIADEIDPSLLMGYDSGLFDENPFDFNDIGSTIGYDSSPFDSFVFDPTLAYGYDSTPFDELTFDTNDISSIIGYDSSLFDNNPFDVNNINGTIGYDSSLFDNNPFDVNNINGTIGYDSSLFDNNPFDVNNTFDVNLISDNCSDIGFDMTLWDTNIDPELIIDDNSISQSLWDAGVIDNEADTFYDYFDSIEQVVIQPAVYSGFDSEDTYNPPQEFLDGLYDSSPFDSFLYDGSTIIGFDIGPFDGFGFDGLSNTNLVELLGFDTSLFDTNGFDQLTNTELANEFGFDTSLFDTNVFDQLTNTELANELGFDTSLFDTSVFDQLTNTELANELGFDSVSFDSVSFDQLTNTELANELGFDTSLFDTSVFDQLTNTELANELGFDSVSFDTSTFDMSALNGFDTSLYDTNGFDTLTDNDMSSLLGWDGVGFDGTSFDFSEEIPVINVSEFGFDSLGFDVSTEAILGETEGFDNALFDAEIAGQNDYLDEVGFDIDPYDYRYPKRVGFDSEPFDAYRPSIEFVRNGTIEQTIYVASKSYVLGNSLLNNNNRLWVTLNGRRLNGNTDYNVSKGTLTLSEYISVSEDDDLVITSYTDFEVSNECDFRIFKDMNDTTGLFKISKDVSTILTQDLLITDDIIHVRDASKLGMPNMEKGRFGIIMINGERITYRERDLLNNTVSGLRRGTAGTGFSYDAGSLAGNNLNHSKYSLVEDMSKNALLPIEWDKSWYSTTVIEVPNNSTNYDGSVIISDALNNVDSSCPTSLDGGTYGNSYGGIYDGDTIGTYGNSYGGIYDEELSSELSSSEEECNVVSLEYGIAEQQDDIIIGKFKIC